MRGSAATDQLDDVLDRFAPPLAPYTRCVTCGGQLEPVDVDDVAHLLQPGTLRTYRDFVRCARCGRPYWHGAHGRRLDALVEDVLGRHG
ncbi:Mut7-C RNAse domain-containing protein [Georgenia sp. SUBG003]|uniref:Mut7-C RNAse domain-containing protein n=1 Tax=Georgenia sp. SUBG003 TaxID=1497974 RepID=UPI000A5CC37F